MRNMGYLEEKKLWVRGGERMGTKAMFLDYQMPCTLYEANTQTNPVN